MLLQTLQLHQKFYSKKAQKRPQTYIHPLLEKKKRNAAHFINRG